MEINQKLTATKGKVKVIAEKVKITESLIANFLGKNLNIFLKKFWVNKSQVTAKTDSWKLMS